MRLIITWRNICMEDPYITNETILLIPEVLIDHWPSYNSNTNTKKSKPCLIAHVKGNIKVFIVLYHIIRLTRLYIYQLPAVMTRCCTQGACQVASCGQQSAASSIIMIQ